MSLIGKEVVEFTCDAYKNGEFVQVSKKDLMGKWSVLCFYPADFTFVCPTELADLQEVYESDLKDLGVEVYSVSTDTHYVHKAWHDTSESIKKITYAMIGDPTHVLARGFCVLMEDAGLAQRGTFLIDPDGIVRAFEITDVGIGRDARNLVSKVKAAQYVRNNPNEVCPAKFGRDGKTLPLNIDLIGKI